MSYADFKNSLTKILESFNVQDEEQSLEEGLNRSGRVTSKKANEILTMIEKMDEFGTDSDHFIQTLSLIDTVIRKQDSNQTTSKILTGLKSGSIFLVNLKTRVVRGSEDIIGIIDLKYNYEGKKSRASSVQFIYKFTPVYKVKTRNIQFYDVTVSSNVGNNPEFKTEEYKMSVDGIDSDLITAFDSIGVIVKQATGTLAGVSLISKKLGVFRLSSNGYLRKKSPMGRDQVVKRFPVIVNQKDFNDVLNQVYLILDNQIARKK